MIDKVPHVVIVGGGFGGLAAAKALKKAAVRLTLIDRTNHHLFQPLLYQVATSMLSPGHIASPIRSILRGQENATVLLGDVTGVDERQRCVCVDMPDRTAVPVPYDYLVIATGVRHSYFGHDEFARFAPAMKTLADAVDVRNKILAAFELAETEEQPAEHRDLLTFVLVGGGPTGVEMAGAIATMVGCTLKSEFRRIDPQSTRVILIEGSPRILAGFSEGLSKKAHQRLTRLGVEVRPGTRVDHIDQDGVIAAGERIWSKTVIWTAGVTPSPAGKWLKAETDRSGRVRVQNDLTIPGHPEIFVIGDVASLEENGRPLPGVAQVALQQGQYAGKVIERRLTGRNAPAPFRYLDKGSLAVVGKNFAVLESGNVRMSGWLAWLAWVVVHLQFLAQSSLRLTVLVQWLWTYVTGQRGARLIVNHYGCPRTKPADEAKETVAA